MTHDQTRDLGLGLSSLDAQNSVKPNALHPQPESCCGEHRCCIGRFWPDSLCLSWAPRFREGVGFKVPFRDLL